MISNKIFSKNGVPIHLLQTPKGMSTIGLAVPIGSINSQISGSTSVTLEAKLRQAIGSPEQAFVNQLYPTFDSSKEFSTFSINFLPEKEKCATDVLTKIVDGLPVTEQQFEKTLEINRKDDEMGEYNNKQKFFDLGCYSSFGDKRYQNSAHVSFLEDQKPMLNNSLIAELPKQSILFGTSDMEGFLTQFADSCLKPANNVPAIETPPFSPGKYIIAHKESLLQGTKVSMQSNLSLCTVSFPSCGAKSSDKPIYDVLTKIFGGGFAFSSEGLGSGFNTILYKSLLCKIPSIREAFAFNFSLSTNGIFSIGFVVDPHDIKKSGKYIKESVGLCLKNINNEVLDEAKMLLLTSNTKSLGNYATRISSFASSLIYNELPIVGKEYADAVRNVSKDDILRIAQNCLVQKPGICIYGQGNPDDLACSFE